MTTLTREPRAELTRCTGHLGILRGISLDSGRNRTGSGRNRTGHSLTGFSSLRVTRDPTLGWRRFNTRHGTARQIGMRSCSAALRQAADHALILGTKRAQQVQRIMLKLMLPARATRWPIPDRTLPSGNLPRPPQPARTITGPGPNAFELLKEDADQLGVGEGSEEAATPRRGLPTCRSDLAQQVRDGCPFLAEEEAQLEAAAARRSP